MLQGAERDGSNDIRLFDWDAWRIGSGADDLAYMMAMHWYPDRRHRLEAPLLDLYHDVLLAHGVSGYDRAALALDYRPATLRRIMWPRSHAIANVPPVIWWNKLERILLAFDDLAAAICRTKGPTLGHNPSWGSAHHSGGSCDPPT